MGCTALLSASFPLLRADTYQQGAFMGCTSLSEIYMPVFYYVASSMFNGCTNLRSVELPSVTHVGSSAFYGCQNLSWVSFQKAVSIYDWAFAYCSSLESLYLLSTSVCILCDYTVSTFIGTPMKDSSILGHYGSIYVPSSLYDTYVSNAYWRNAGLSARIASYVEGGE